MINWRHAYDRAVSHRSKISIISNTEVVVINKVVVIKFLINQFVSNTYIIEI